VDFGAIGAATNNKRRERPRSN